MQELDDTFTGDGWIKTVKEWNLHFALREFLARALKQARLCRTARKGFLWWDWSEVFFAARLAGPKQFEPSHANLTAPRPNIFCLRPGGSAIWCFSPWMWFVCETDGVTAEKWASETYLVRTRDVRTKYVVEQLLGELFPQHPNNRQLAPIPPSIISRERKKHYVYVALHRQVSESLDASTKN